MPDRVCVFCGGSLDGMRPQALYCCPKHRAAASRQRAAERVPERQTGPEPVARGAAPQEPHVRFVDGSTRTVGAELVTRPRNAAPGSARTTRLRKATCDCCGCIIRLSRKWIRRGLPTCACGGSFLCADAELRS